MPELPDGTPRHHVVGQDHGLDRALDNTLIQLAEGALTDGQPVRMGALWAGAPAALVFLRHYG